MIMGSRRLLVCLAWNLSSLTPPHHRSFPARLFPLVALTTRARRPARGARRAALHAPAPPPGSSARATPASERSPPAPPPAPPRAATRAPAGGLRRVAPRPRACSRARRTRGQTRSGASGPRGSCARTPRHRASRAAARRAHARKRARRRSTGGEGRRELSAGWGGARGGAGRGAGETGSAGRGRQRRQHRRGGRQCGVRAASRSPMKTPAGRLHTQWLNGGVVGGECDGRAARLSAGRSSGARGCVRVVSLGRFRGLTALSALLTAGLSQRRDSLHFSHPAERYPASQRSGSAREGAERRRRRC
jgi:hypothetical protein